MGMKEPMGKAEKIGGTISSPKPVSQYRGVGNAGTKAKPTGVESDIANGNLPKPKGTGKNSTAC